MAGIAGAVDLTGKRLVHPRILKAMADALSHRGPDHASFLQRDGVCILLGHLMNVASIVYFGILIGGGAVVIKKAIERFF